MKVDNEVAIFENKYFCVVASIYRGDGLHETRVRVRTRRKDTGEYVKFGFFKVGKNDEEVLQECESRVREILIPEIEAVGEPYEWGCQSRKILVSCQEYIERTKQFGAFCLGLISSGDADNEFGQKYAEFISILISTGAAITASLESLSKSERLSVLRSPPDVFDDPSDSWSLIDLEGREKLFYFFADPSEAEIASHDKQLAELASRFDELNWKSK